MRHSFLSQWRLAAVATGMVAAVLSLSSCSDDDDNTNPAPTVKLASATATNAPGSVVSVSATVEAPAGGKTLSFLVNGVSNSSMPDVALKGDASETVTKDYTIPANAVVGSTINISLQATDKQDQTSTLATVVVTVSSTPTKPIVEVSGNITTDTRWTADKIYRISNFVNVGTDTKDKITATATLTIEAGTVIYGATGTPGGTLIVHRGSKIMAEGTEAKPIVFTSNEAVRKPGNWGGLVICGQATNNTGGVVELEGAYGGFHGSATPNNADNSGILKYVRVEFAGYPINPNQEINGITFGSVGTGTTLDHIQVSYCADDSYEWFGGTVNATNLISYKAQDDDFDTDNGFSGKIQFGLVIRDAQLADQSGSNAFESDNDPNGTTATPATQPVFSNITVVGPKQTAATSVSSQFQNGAHIRRGSKMSLINSVITGFPTGIFIDGTAGSSITSAANGELVIKKNILAGVTSWGGNNFGTAANADEQAALGTSAAGSNHPNPPRGRIFAAGTIPSGSNPYQNGVLTITETQISGQNGLPWFRQNNTVVAKWDDASLGLSASAFEPLNGAPTLLPTGAALLDGANFDGFTGLNTAGKFIGAFGTTDWTKTWANWTPLNTDYSK